MANLEPLGKMYLEMGFQVPDVHEVTPERMPDSQRRLLVHDQDMTPTLEAAFDARIHLRVLHYSLAGGVMNRLVALVLDGSERAVEIGAIRIFLNRLPEAARYVVMGLYRPFGSILRDFAIPHHSRPSSYFQVAPDALMAQVLNSNGTSALYGRTNTLLDEDGCVLAEVVEILPPLGASGSL